MRHVERQLRRGRGWKDRVEADGSRDFSDFSFSFKFSFDINHLPSLTKEHPYASGNGVTCLAGRLHRHAWILADVDNNFFSAYIAENVCSRGAEDDFVDGEEARVGQALDALVKPEDVLLKHRLGPSYVRMNHVLCRWQENGSRPRRSFAKNIETTRNVLLKDLCRHLLQRRAAQRGM